MGNRQTKLLFCCVFFPSWTLDSSALYYPLELLSSWKLALLIGTLIVQNIFKQEMCPVGGFGYDFGDIRLKWPANGLHPVRLHLYGQLREREGNFCPEGGAFLHTLACGRYDCLWEDLLYVSRSIPPGRCSKLPSLSLDSRVYDHVRSTCPICTTDQNS